MTSHDINEEVLLLMDRLMWRNTAEQETEEIRDCLVRVASQAYEEAAKAVCHMCDTATVAATLRTERGHDYGQYFHDYGDEVGIERCHASEIHALKDSLNSSPENTSLQTSRT